MRAFLISVMLLWGGHCPAQSLAVTVTDTTSGRIRTAIRFLERYLGSFEAHQTPDYTQFWSAADCWRSRLPDHMAYSITTDGPTYRFCYRPVVFYARDEHRYIHLKTLFATTDSSMAVSLWAITNHYVTLDGAPKFVSELELHQGNYRSIRNRNITYYFPASMTFSYARSNRMLARLKRIERQWGFKPVGIQYYFAANDVGLAKMRGLDYNYDMDKVTPSGMTYAGQRMIFCQGLGEGYLHEVLHVYFSPRYGQSPMCHAMIYYLAGGLGHDFSWMIRRMNRYLRQYPETDLSQYGQLLTKDPMLHIDHVTKGLLCRMMEEKDGIAGLKRALQYPSVDALLEAEFGVGAAALDSFLKAGFRRYDPGPVHTR